MRTVAGRPFSIIREGELQEETWEWSDIETMFRAGKLSPNTLVFLPEENAWKKLADTDLAGCFAPGGAAGRAAAVPPAENEDNGTENEALLDEIRANPTDVPLRLKAAGLAVAAGRPDEAREHYQQALEAAPYHPRVAQEAKRRLPPSQWRALRFLEKPPPVWDEPGAIVSFAVSRGPLYLAVPVFALTVMFHAVWSAAAALPVLALWAMEIARSSSMGERRAPSGRGLVADPWRRIARPLLAVILTAVGLSAAFIAIAGVLIATRTTAETQVLRVIAGSPVQSVILCTLCIAYLPAVVMLAGASRRGLLDLLNPRRVVSAVRRMEGEYIAAVLTVAAGLSAMWGVGALIGRVPVLAHAVHAAFAVLITVAGGFILGRLYARFREELDPREDGESTSE